MKRKLAAALSAALLVGLLAAPASAKNKDDAGKPQDLQCADATSANKIDADAFVDGQGTWTDVPGDDGESYTVVGTLDDSKTISFEVFDADGNLVDGATTVFCVKGGPANSGEMTASGYTVDFENRGGNLPDVSNVVVYSVVIPPQDPGDPEATNQWCSPGYWKNQFNHWPSGYSPEDAWGDTTFSHLEVLDGAIHPGGRNANLVADVLSAAAGLEWDPASSDDNRSCPFPTDASGK